MGYAIAGVAIEERGRYLMVQEKLEKCYGQWNWPAGHVDEGETYEQAAIREAKEEVGVDVELGEKIGEWVDRNGERTRVLFAAKRTKGDIRIKNDEILGIAWLTKNEMTALRNSMRVCDWTSDMVGVNGND